MRGASWEPPRAPERGETAAILVVPSAAGGAPCDVRKTRPTPPQPPQPSPDPGRRRGLDREPREPPVPSLVRRRRRHRRGDPWETESAVRSGCRLRGRLGVARLPAVTSEAGTSPARGPPGDVVRVRRRCGRGSWAGGRGPADGVTDPRPCPAAFWELWFLPGGGSGNPGGTKAESLGRAQSDVTGGLGMLGNVVRAGERA